MRRQPIASTGIDAPAASQVTPQESADGGGHRVDAPVITPPAPAGPRRIATMVGTPSNWRVRTKLIAILAVPMIAILVNASIGANAVLTSTRNVNRVRDMVQVSRSAATLVYELERERTYTVGYAADRRPQRSLDPVKLAQTRVDQAVAQYESVVRGREDSFTPATQVALDAVADRLNRRSAIRSAALNMTSPDSVLVAYTAVITSLVDLVSLIPQGEDDTDLTSGANATEAITRAGELLAEQQALVYGVLQKKQFESSDYRTFIGLMTERESQISRFEAAATPTQSGLYRSTVTGEDVSLVADASQQVLTTQAGQSLELEAQKWLRSTQVTMENNRKVLESLLTDIGSRVQELRSNIQRNALIRGLLIVVILTVALLAAMVVARSLVRPLLALRAAAQDIAGRRLPEAVRRLRDSTDQDIDAEIEPVGIDTEEEIGEVARAFDEVHREAIRLASEQAVLRNNVNAMFVNLSRRSQGLVERQLRLIDDLENREQDPDQLANLFKLDHLATRMRRNNESLLVLAGTDTARRWTHPVPLNEVVLAAISEVEQYTRVKQTAAASVSIAGHAVSDVVHLIAELLENATSFSPPATDVQVTSHSLGPGAGAMIEIEDRGIGMPAKELERINERLANPPIVDVSVSRTMGLFAVGRLATRHGIRVQLRESNTGGITAVVRLPAKVVAGDPASATPSRPGSAALPAGRPTTPSRAGVDAFSAVLQNGHAAGGNAMSNGSSMNGAMSNGSATNGAMSNGSGHLPTEPGRLSDPTRPSPPFGPGSGLNGDRGSRSGSDRANRDRGYRQPDGERTVNAADPGLDQINTRGALDSGTGPRETTHAYRSETDPYALEGQRTRDDRQIARPEAHPRSLDGSSTGGYELPRERDRGSTPTGISTGPTQTGFDSGPTRPGAFDTGPTYTGSFDTGPTRTGAFDTGPTRTGAFDTGPTHLGRDPDPDVGLPGVRNAEPDVSTGHGRYGHTSPGLHGQPDFNNRNFEPSDQSSFGRENVAREVGLDHETDDADTTPIFDSVSAWFDRRPPAAPAGPPLPARRTAPAQSQLRRPGLAVHRGATANGGRSLPPEPLGRPGSQGSGMASGEVARHGGPVPPPGRIADPISANDQSRAIPDLPLRGRGLYAPIPAEPTRTPTGPGPGRDNGDPQADHRRPGEPTRWVSPADAGWQAAEAAREPSASGTTRSGLPVRVPMTHLVPGSADPGPRRRPAEAPTRSPEAVGGRLASFYQGVRQGRDVTRDAASTSRRDAQEDM